MNNMPEETTPDEIKNDLRIYRKTDYAGIRINIEDRFFCSKNTSNSLIVGNTRSGKTKRILVPLLYTIADAGESAVVADLKGELWESTSGYFEKQDYEVKILDLYNPINSFSWNPLQLPYESFLNDEYEESIHMLSSLSDSIFYTMPGKDDFWDSTSGDLFIALALSLFKIAKSKTQINLTSIALMGGSGNERLGSQSILQAFFENKNNSIEYLFANAVINAPQDTRQSIFSVFNNKVQHFSLNTKLTRTLSMSEIDIKKLNRQKTVIFLRGSSFDEKTNALFSVFIKQCYSCLSSKNTSDRYVNFVLDDLCDFPFIPNLFSMLSNAAYYRLRFWLSINSLSIMNNKYSENVMAGIKHNCLDWYILNCMDFEGLEKVLGGDNLKKLRQLKRGEAYALISEIPPFQTIFKDHTEYCPEINVKSIKGSRNTYKIDTFDLKSYMRNSYAAKSFPSFDVDELVKKIDKKIEQLEADEKAEKERAENCLEGKKQESLDN